jgi:hypothetical protein
MIGSFLLKPEYSVIDFATWTHESEIVKVGPDGEAREGFSKVE